MFLAKSVVHHPVALSACLVACIACGDDTITNPTEVTLGETTFVVLVNPAVNDANATTVPTPGAGQLGVDVSAEGGG